MNSKYQKLGINTLLIFGGKAGGALVTLLMLPLYTHWLTPEEYGTYDLILTYTSALTSFVTCCIADAIFVVPKKVSDEEKKVYYSSGIYFLLSTSIFSLLFFYIFQAIALNNGIHNIFVDYIWFISAVMLSSYAQTFTQSFNLCIEKIKVYSSTGVVLAFFTALYAFLFIPKWGLTGYIYSIVAANLTATLYSFIFSGSYRYCKINGYNKVFLNRLLAYGIPLIPNSVMWWLVNGVNRPVMETTLGLYSIGLFAVASKFPGVLTLLSTVFSNAWGVSLMDEYGKKDFSRFFNKSLKFVFFILIIGACTLVSLSKIIISIFADSQYYEAWKLLPVLILGVIFQSFSGLIGGIFMAKKQSKYFFYSSIWGGLSSLLFTILFIPILGLQGVGFALLASFIVMTVARLKYAWNDMQGFEITYYIKMILLYIGVSITCLFIDNYFIQLLLYSILFLLILLCNKCFIIIVRNALFTRLS